MRDGHFGDFGDAPVIQGDGQTLRPESSALTGRTVVGGHVAVDFPTHIVARGLSETALQVRDHPFVGSVIVADLAGPVPVAQRDDVPARPV